MIGTGASAISASVGECQYSTAAMPPTVATTRIICRNSVLRNDSSRLMSLLRMDIIPPVW